MQELKTNLLNKLRFMGETRAKLATQVEEPIRNCWADAFKRMHKNNDDELLIPDIFEDEKL